MGNVSFTIAVLHELTGFLHTLLYSASIVTNLLPFLSLSLSFPLPPPRMAGLLTAASP